jgi:putative oxidoreductase
MRTPYDKYGTSVQRLFSTFPGSWPGFGLLLLRCALGVALTCSGTAGLLGTVPDPAVFAQRGVAVAGGIFLIVGLWTPVMGILVALDEVWIALSIQSLAREGMWIHIFLAIVAVSMAMLGPGAWSIDARLFGRKRIDLNSRGRRPSL